MKNRYWRIQGYDSTELIFERRILVGQLTDSQIRDLLKALTAKAGLTFNEIIGAYAKRRTRIANDLLSVRRDGAGPTIWCGDNPHFIACMVDENGKVVPTKGMRPCNRMELSRRDAMK